MTEQTKIFHVDYDSEGNGRVIKEEVIRENQGVELDFDFLEALTVRSLPGGDKVRMSLKEAFLSNPDAANILRTDLKQVAFSAMAAAQRTYPMFTNEVSSNKPQEEYIRDAAIGVIPEYISGTPRPQVQSGFEGGTIIKNGQRSMSIPVPMDLIRFDQLGKIRQIAQEMGLAAVLTDEDSAYKAITTTGNYTRAKTSNDNDIGANTRTLTWSADNFREAKATITTSKDRKSGAYLGYMPDCLISTPLMEVPVMQLLMSTELQRTHGSTTVEAIGTGTRNPMYGTVRKIMFSPWFGQSYQWALCDSTRGTFVRQNVEGWNIYQETPNATSESFMTHDAINYMILAIFGVGFIDDRAWFYSDSTTDAAVS